MKQASSVSIVDFRFQIKLFVFHPSLQKIVEGTLMVHMNATLADATQTAWKVPNCHHSVFPIQYTVWIQHICITFDKNSPLNLNALFAVCKATQAVNVCSTKTSFSF